MRTIIVRDNMRIPLGKQGENNAVRVVWPKIAEKYAKLYGDGRFELVIVQKGKAYPAVVNVDGTNLVWDVRRVDVATAEVGSLELIYYAGDTVAKSQTWETRVIASKSADGMTEPPEDPARAWFDAIKHQIGDLSKLTTKAKDNLVAAINEAARTGSGGGGTVEMRVDGGYIQYSTDGVTWENLIAVATLEGKPGKDGHTPKITATKTGKTTSITADGMEIAQIKDGEDAATDISLGLTSATIGQTIKVKAIDTDGKPTAWEAVDMAGGEAMDFSWEHIRDVELTPDVIEAIVSTTDAGNAFSYDEIMMEFIPNLEGYFYVRASQNALISKNVQVWVTNAKYSQIHFGLLNKKIAITSVFRTDGSLGFSNGYGGSGDIDKISTIVFGASSAVGAAFTVKVWGR